MPTLEERVAALEAQQAGHTRLERLMLEGRLDGPMPNAAAELVALEGGQTKINVQLGKDSGQ